MSLLRHWSWADRIRELSEEKGQKDFNKNFDGSRFQYYNLINPNLSLPCLWYGLLFAVCVGIEDLLNIQVKEIAPTFEKHKVKLKQFRHAIFHVQPIYWSKNIENVFTDEELNSEIKSIHDSVGIWLNNELESIGKKLYDDPIF